MNYQCVVDRFMCENAIIIIISYILIFFCDFSNSFFSFFSNSTGIEGNLK